MAEATGRPEEAAGTGRCGRRSARPSPTRSSPPTAARLGHPDRLRARPAHGPGTGRPAAAAAGHLVEAIGARGLAPDHRLRRRRLPAAGAQLGRAHRRRVPAARAADAPVLAVHDRPGRDHDLGALGRLVERARLPVGLDELVQPLLARLGRRVALPVRAGHRPGAGHGRLRPAAAAPAPRRAAGPCQRLLPVGARAGPGGLGARGRPVRLPGGGPAERPRQRARAERRPRRGARRGRRPPGGGRAITPGCAAPARPSSRSGRGATSSPGRPGTAR